MHTENDEFDLMLRSMMADAEEEVPSGVWSGVSGRLERNRSVVFWRRVAIASAAAAAIAAGVFLSFQGVNSTNDNILVETQQAEPSQAPAGEERLSTPERLLAEASTATVGGAALVEKNTTLSSLQDEVISSFVHSAQGEDAQASSSVPVERPAVPIEAEAPETQPETDAPAVTESPEAAITNETDPFAAMAWEDARSGKSSSISLSVGGTVQSNGDARSNGSFGMKHSPSASRPVKSSLVQKGKESSYSIPVTFGLGLRFRLTDHWAIGTGVNFSMMERTFSGVYTEAYKDNPPLVISSDVRNKIYYIGIPVNLYYNIFDGKRLNLYAFGGFTGEKGVANRFTVQNSPSDIHIRRSVKGLQFSAAAGFGLEFMLSDRFGLYVDPSLRYFFDTDQPVSIRTQQPFTLNFEIGLRLDL